MKQVFALMVCFCLFLQKPVYAKVDYEQIAKESIQILVEEYVKNIVKEAAKEQVEELAKKYVEQATIDCATKGAEVLGSLVALDGFLKAETDKAKGFAALNYFLPPEPTAAAIFLVIQIADAAISAQHAKKMMELQIEFMEIRNENEQLDNVGRKNSIYTFSKYAKYLVESKSSIEKNFSNYQNECSDAITEIEIQKCVTVSFNLLMAIQSYFYSKTQLEVLIQDFDDPQKITNAFYEKDQEERLLYLIEELGFMLKDYKDELLSMAIDRLIEEINFAAKEKAMELISKIVCKNKVLEMSLDLSVEERTVAVEKCEVRNEN